MNGWRSLLFVPAGDDVRLAKAHTRGADALILDLEDAVAEAAKPAARENLAGAAASLKAKGAEILVRINGPAAQILRDLDVSVRAEVASLVVPKAEDPRSLETLSEAIAKLETARGLAPGAIGLVALVETPLGLLRAPALAAVGRVNALALGSEDFALAMGAPPSPALLDLPCRQLALAAAAHGKNAYGLPISLAQFRDLGAYAAAAAAARSVGMTGALCIHPAQVVLINRAFTPSPAEVADAQQVVKAWRAAGEAGVIALDGKMIDRPVAERASRVLQRARTGMPGRAK